MKTHPKCSRCGWKYGNFHICVDLTDDYPGKYAIKPQKKLSDSHKAKIAEAQQERLARRREQYSERDAEIIRLYNAGGVGVTAVAREVGCAPATAQKVLKRAELKSLVVMRRRGHTLAKGAK